MDRRITSLLLLLAGALCSLPVQAESRWYAIRLGDAHIGYLHRERIEADGVIETRNALSLVLKRNGQLLPVASSERHRESVDGQPLGFASRLETGGTLAEVEGERHGERWQVRITQGEQRIERELDWPTGARLAEGQRQALLRVVRGELSKLEVLAFDPAAIQALPLLTEQVGRESLGDDRHAPSLIRLRQTLGQGEALIRNDLWVSPDSGEIEQMRMPALGLELLLTACSRECATAPPIAADVFDSTLVPAPRALSRRDRERPLQFRIEAGDTSLAPLARVPGQQLREGSDGAQLAVDPAGDASHPPTDQDLAPGRWLQSDDPSVRALAAKAVGRSRSVPRRMQRLENAVRSHISRKSLRVGYASAAEVITLREGDCTEHAVLLAAMARAEGIPARVVTGLAYSPGYAGRNDVFVPHAWVMAWVEGRWRGYDAALPAFGAGHIGLSIGNGEPYDFYSGIELLGRLRVLEISADDEDRGA